MERIKYYMFTLFLFYIVQHADGATRIDPLVDTQVGLIRGLRAADGEYSMFMGIPYATVDEANPFGASTPHPGFDEVFEAVDDSAICPQVEEFNNTIVGSLDCLHLNIYVPNSATSRNRLPVLVWIYGGGFSIGFSGRYLYGPKYLVRHDVILVTINYRVGPYGFMCLNTPEVPGNQGLKDQELALQWIKSNIDAFGGDADKITIFGESAGGASVDLHLFFNNENLFNQVILQSGSSMGPWTIGDPDPSKALELANYLGASTESVDEALGFLATVDTKLVIAATAELDIVFRPCVEKTFEDVKSFVSKHPLNMEVPRAGNIPILIGNNNDERAANSFNDNAILLFQKTLATYFQFGDEELSYMESLVRHFYIGDENINEQSIRGVYDFDSDFSFNYPTLRSIQKYIDNGVKVLYQYLFSYNGKRNFVKSRINMTEGGALHADEISYLFDISFMKDEPSPEDQLIIDRVTKLWTNFVKYGNPTPEISELLPVTWLPVTKDTSFYINIDSEMTLERRPFHGRMAFWDLFYELNKSLEKAYIGKRVDDN